MKIDKNTIGLISEIEYRIGNSCYNPNSYDGYTEIEGKKFRYPVYTVKDGKQDKHYGKVNLSTDEALSLKYKFGSNHLLIGRGIVSVLEFLEKRYDIDFNELEKELNKSSK